MNINKLIKTANNISPLICIPKLELNWDNYTLRVNDYTIGWIDSGRLCNVHGEDGSFLEIYGQLGKDGFPKNCNTDDLYSFKIRQILDSLSCFDVRFCLVKKMKDGELVPTLSRPGPRILGLFQ